MLFFISFLAGVVLFYSFNYFPFTSVFVFLLASIYLCMQRRFLLIIFILSGVLYALLRYEPSHDVPYIKDNIEVKGICSSYPVKTEAGTVRQPFSVESAVNSVAGEKIDALDGKEIMLFSDKKLDVGTEYDLIVKLLRSRQRLNPGQQVRDDIYANLLEVRNSGNQRLSLHSMIEKNRYRVNSFIEENLGKDSGAFVESITTGETANISEELKDAFSITGLTHILSISGSHFGIFSVLLFGVFRFFINAMPYRVLQRITVFLTPSQVAALFCLPFMLAYLGLSGASIPAVRSFIMISIVLCGLLIGRKGFWLNSLFFAAFVIVVWDPESLFSLSFQLSFLAVLFIGFSVRSSEDDKKEERKIVGYIKDASLMTFSASIGTAPLVAYYFHYFSIISPVSNLLIAPLIGFILIPLSVISSFMFLITGHFITTPVVSAVSDASIFLVRLFSGIPFADIKIPAFPPIIIVFFYAGFLFYFLFDKRKQLLLIPFIPLAVCFLLSISDKKSLTATFLDVGQGDSSVVELPDGKTIVIDTGKTGRETASFIKYRGRKTIDALILSHIHPDHTGGSDYLTKKFKVEELWDNGRIILPDFLIDIKHRSLGRGDVIEGFGYKMHVLHPYPEFYTMNKNECVSENNDSLVLKIAGNHTSFLFTGDIEKEAQEDIIHLRGWLKCEVIKVPHHGGRTSAYGPFLKEVSPDAAVISVGRDNSFGHPHEETLNMLQDLRIFRTDIDGAVKMKESFSGLEIKTFRNFQFEKAESFRDEMKNIKRLFDTW
jgi:competence protein ComEC